jgi:putative methyltransferase (TIGR04325 family)
VTLVKRILSRLRRLVPGSSTEPVPSPIWAGVYRNFDEMQGAGEGFSSGDAAVAAERLLRETEADPIPDEAIIDHQVLALTVRLAGRDPVRIVDLGGGVGQSFAALRRMAGAGVALHYCIVEVPSIVEYARSLWPGSQQVTFVESLEDVPFVPDIVFAKGAIQYWSDYTEGLRRLFALSATWVLLEKASLLMNREYATEQLNVYESRIPYWFMSRERILEVAEQCGYALVLHRRLEREYDQSAFPAELRIGRAASLLFERRSA